MTHQGQVLTKFNKVTGNTEPQWTMSVAMRGRLGWLVEWWAPRGGLGMFASGPRLHKTQVAPHKLCKDPSATRGSRQEFCYSFQPVQPTVTYLQRQMTLGKLLSQYSFSICSAYCLVVTAFDWLPGLVLHWLACHTAFSLLCFLSTGKSFTKGCETQY